MVISTNELSEVLDVEVSTIKNWENALGLSSSDLYSEKSINLFRKVKSMILSGYTLKAIKGMMSSELYSRNEVEDITKSIVIEDYENLSKGDEKILNNYCESPSAGSYKGFSQSFLPNSSIGSTLEQGSNKSNVLVLVQTLLKELRHYSDRTIEAEKKLFKIEDKEKRVKEDYDKMSAEFERLKMELEAKERKLKDYEEQKKRLNLMEVEMKIMQLENQKKGFFGFWK